MNSKRTRPHVLLVEDEHVIRQLWIEELEEDGRYTLTGVAGPDDAVAVLSNGPVQAAIIDIGLPKMSGEELIGMARAIVPRLPILAVTGFDAASYRHLGDLGIQVLQKPFRTSWLLFHLNALLITCALEAQRIPAPMPRNAVC